MCGGYRGGYVWDFFFFGRMRPLDLVVTGHDAPTSDRLEQRRLARLGPAQDQVQLVGLEDGRDAVQGGDGALPPAALEEALDGVGHGLVDGGEGRGFHAHAYLFVGVGGCFCGVRVYEVCRVDFWVELMECGAGRELQGQGGSQ